MTDIVDWLTTELVANPLLVSAVVMLLSMAEAVIVVGMFVPGVTIVLAISAAAGATGHGLTALFLATTLGTIAGDVISYWVGRRYGMSIAAWEPLRRRPHVFAAAERHFERRGWLSVALARFVPAVRTMVPTFAGIARMRASTFMLANAVSGVAWAALHVYGAGFTGRILAEVGGRLAVVLFGVLVALGLAIWLARLAATITVTWLLRLRRVAHGWVTQREGRAARFLDWTLDPEDLTGLLMVLWASVLFMALHIFAELTEEVWDGEDIVNVDLALSGLVQSFRSPDLDAVMVGVTMMGDALVLTFVALAAVGWLLYRRAWWLASAFVGFMLLPLGFVPLVKAVLARDRPLTDLYSGVDNFSFPSGHATHSMVLFGLLAALVGGSYRGARRWVIGGAVATLPLAIAGSRIYLQAHWPSDVAAGLAFATAVAVGFLLLVSWLPAGSVGPRGLAVTAVTALLVAWSGNLYFNYAAERQAYAPRELAVPLDETEWREAGWEIIGPGRIGFEGRMETPFLLQWVGDLAPLHAALEADGWQPGAPWSFAALGRFTDPEVNARTFPVLPQLHLGRAATQTWVRPTGARERLVLRVWRTRYRVGGAPLFVAAVEDETLHDLLGFLTVADDGTPPAPELTRLEEAITAAAGPDTRWSLSPYLETAR